MKRQHRKKELSEVQELKQQNKKLREENRSLQKEISRLRKQEHLVEEALLKEAVEYMIEADEPKVQRCKECNKGELIERFVVGRMWWECSVCDYDSRKK